jgi:pimeloyl-ACP methyl ester carboxylesterase
LWSFRSFTIHAGGPGGSGVEVVADRGPEFSERFQGLYDLISWDPRGIGYTTWVRFADPQYNLLIVSAASPGPVYCFDTAEEDEVFWENTVVSYINETIAGKFDQQDLNELYSQANATDQKFKTLTAGCQNGPSGRYLKYLGTSSNVRDLVSLGDAIVGQGQPIDYWGVSYGTVIGFGLVNSELSKYVAAAFG